MSWWRSGGGRRTFSAEAVLGGVDYACAPAVHGQVETSGLINT